MTTVHSAGPGVVDLATGLRPLRLEPAQAIGALEIHPVVLAGEPGLAIRSNVGSRGSVSAGRWREPAGVPPLRSRKKRFTIRSSRLWKVTTASRPPGFNARSAASRPCSSSSSSAFKWMRIAWKVRVAGSLLAPGR